MIYNIILLIISIIIYLSFGITPFIFITISSLYTFLIAKKLKGNKPLLIISIIINLLPLIYFKFFFNYFNLLIPLGISYYTLQLLSYIIDVYNNKYKYETNIIYFFLYVTYIPHLFIGPISRYNDIKKELIKKKRITSNNIYQGLIRILWGLVKKLIIAARISILVNNVVDNELKGIVVLITCLLYSIEIYTDFSGGIDIVLGISKILDIELVENFNSPYLAENMKEFWKYWHISLSTWLKDYIYIPLGGNKKRKTLNTIITFLVSGLWHGLNYLLWGVINGILVLLGNKYNTKYKKVNRIINYVIISLLWIFFIYPNNITSINRLLSIFSNFTINLSLIGLTISDYIILLISITLLTIYDTNKDLINKKLNNLSLESKIILISSIVLIVLVFGIYGIGFKVEEFIYSKF